MGNKAGCCNNVSQLHNIGQDKFIITQDEPNSYLLSGVSQEVAKVIRKMLATKSNKDIQFPEVQQQINQLLKRSKMKENSTNDNDESIDGDKKQLIGFKCENDIAVYQGTVENGLPDGKGRLLFGNYAYFQGKFINGHPKYGTFIFPGCIAYYHGQIDNFLAHGKGFFQHLQSGYQYDGQWSKNLQNGNGIEKYNNGEQYCGYFNYGSKFGLGKYVFADGSEYEGQFFNDYIDGEGKMTTKSGEIYEGKWKMGKMHGKGKFLWKNGQIYEGDYKNGERQGYGIYYYKNGSRYEGQWSKGLQDGTGKIILGYDQVTGLWCKGKQIEQESD